MNELELHVPFEERIRILNMRKAYVPIQGELIVYADRSHPVLGNPHILMNKADDAARAIVVEDYLFDLRKDFETQGPIYQELCKLARLLANQESVTHLAFMCWCSPKPCHADHLKLKLVELLNKDIK